MEGAVGVSMHTVEVSWSQHSKIGSSQNHQYNIATPSIHCNGPHITNCIGYMCGPLCCCIIPFDSWPHTHGSMYFYSTNSWRSSQCSLFNMKITTKRIYEIVRVKHNILCLLPLYLSFITVNCKHAYALCTKIIELLLLSIFPCMCNCALQTALSETSILISWSHIWKTTFSDEIWNA